MPRGQGSGRSKGKQSAKPSGRAPKRGRFEEEGGSDDNGDNASNGGQRSGSKKPRKRAATPEPSESSESSEASSSSDAPDPPEPEDQEEYAKTMDRKMVVGPVEELVDEELANAWKVNRHNQMCFIFDVVNPARQFKRGMRYKEDQDFADYGPDPWYDLTEDDCKEGSGWTPYKPLSHRCVISFSSLPDESTHTHHTRSKYLFKGKTSARKFLEWTDDELRVVEMQRVVKKRGKATTRHTDWKEYAIPAPYQRIVCQLVAEDLHARSTSNNTHEAIRRQTYAKKALDAFGKELYKLTSPPTPSFRSKVLTPILQRHVEGVPDAYAPTVRAAIAGGNDPGEFGLSIQAVTEWYLRGDPVKSDNMALFRRHLLYLPDVRWHLGVLVKPRTGAAAKEFYILVRANHDKIMADITEHGPPEAAEREGDPPPLTMTEVSVLVSEGLDELFRPELEVHKEVHQISDVRYVSRPSFISLSAHQ